MEALFLGNAYETERPISTLDYIEHIEELHGSQGALYGRNSICGAIDMITRDPGESLRAGADLSYGSFDHAIAKGSVSGPITDLISADA